MNLSEFKKVVLSLEKPYEWGYKFIVGNDERRSEGWVRRTADYSFYLVHCNAEYDNILLEKSYTYNIDKKQEELIKKYSKWANDIIKNNNQ